METKPCPVCIETQAQVWEEITHSEVKCLRCGDFSIGDMASVEISGWKKQQRVNLSGWIRENQKCMIAQPILERLRQLRDLRVGEKAEKILSQLGRKFPRPGESLDLSNGSHLEFKAIGRVNDDNELRFLMREYLCREMGFLLSFQTVGGLFQDEAYKVSPKGWAYLESLQHGNSNSQIGFIAMWFNDSVSDAWRAIHKGIQDSGYEPFRVDQKQHNNKIDDEIVAGIRRSRFLVADFTDHRGGVYFEAGLAMGLGLPVIWLCRKDDLEKTHFDTRQYNHIPWEADKLAELSKALKDRIEATIGRGPHQPTT